MDMQEYKGYFIDGTARMIHPFDPSWYAGGSVLQQGPLGSIIEVARFEMPSFTLELKGVADGSVSSFRSSSWDECICCTFP